MEAKIAAYQRENRDNIMENDARKVKSLLLRSLQCACNSTCTLLHFMCIIETNGLHLRQRRRGHGLTAQQGAQRQENPVPLHQLPSNMRNPPSTQQQLPCTPTLHAWPHDCCISCNFMLYRQGVHWHNKIQLSLLHYSGRVRRHLLSQPHDPVLHLQLDPMQMNQLVVSR